MPHAVRTCTAVILQAKHNGQSSLSGAVYNASAFTHLCTSRNSLTNSFDNTRSPLHLDAQICSRQNGVFRPADLGSKIVVELLHLPFNGSPAWPQALVILYGAPHEHTFLAGDLSPGRKEFVHASLFCAGKDETSVQSLFWLLKDGQDEGSDVRLWVSDGGNWDIGVHRSELNMFACRFLLDVSCGTCDWLYWTYEQTGGKNRIQEVCRVPAYPQKGRLLQQIGVALDAIVQPIFGDEVSRL